jgi:hypothetical protein
MTGIAGVAIAGLFAATVGQAIVTGEVPAVMAELPLGAMPVVPAAIGVFVAGAAVVSLLAWLIGMLVFVVAGWRKRHRRNA